MMALSTVKISSELPFSFHKPITTPLRSHLRLLFSSSSFSSPRRWKPNHTSAKPSSVVAGPGPHRPRAAPSSPWLQQWSHPRPGTSSIPPQDEGGKKIGREDRVFLDSKENATGAGSIERIVHRLRNLGLGLEGEEVGENGTAVDQMPPLDGNQCLGELLERRWDRPGISGGEQEGLLPWDRDDGDGRMYVEDGERKELRRRRMKAPTLAELTMEDTELRRLRTLGMTLRERMTVPKAGVTQAIVENIHDVWRRSELVRLKFHESLAHDMKTAHDLVERRTGGLVIWRSGSVMVVFRGSNYKRPSGPYSSELEANAIKSTHEGDKLFVPDVSSASKVPMETNHHSLSSTLDKTKPSPMTTQLVDSLTEEEEKFNSLLDGLGPRFLDWWGTGILPVDADLLPEDIPGFKPPFRLLPAGMRTRLTNSEMTNLRKLARSLPCHFALGRNRHHHGLAAAILNLWENSLVVKIAVKRGIQNTNNKLMAEELKILTGGTLLLRNKYYIVIYRGKDFLPTSVATALAERQELTKNIQDVEEKVRNTIVEGSQADSFEGHALAGTLAEFQEAQARWGRPISTLEREEMKEEASKSKATKLYRRIQHKLYIAQAKKLRAEKLLAKIEESMVPVSPSDDQEMLTDEERSVYRKMGLRMKQYLPLGIRGVFDGVIENMHLHWKHRELVKLISKQKTLSFVEDTARLLAYESGGLLVAIERVPKGFALIYYRGKNYQRPISLRPRNLLTKAKALKRSVAMQRHEALSQHIVELERSIDQMKSDMGISEDDESLTELQNGTSSWQIQSDDDLDFNQIENETPVGSDDDTDEEIDDHDDENPTFC